MKTIFAQTAKYESSQDLDAVEHRLLIFETIQNLKQYWTNYWIKILSPWFLEPDHLSILLNTYGTSVDGADDTGSVNGVDDTGSVNGADDTGSVNGADDTGSETVLLTQGAPYTGSGNDSEETIISDSEGAEY